LSWDSGGYLLLAQRLMWVLRGDFPSLEAAVKMMTPPGMANEWYGFHGSVLFLGLLFHGVGFSPIAGTFVNSLWYMLAVVLVYRIAAELFSRSVARCAGTLAVVFPSTFYWSINNGKEPLATFAVALTVWAALRWVQRWQWRHLFGCVTGIAALWIVKPRMAATVAAVGCLGLVVAACRQWRWMRYAVAGCVGLLLTTDVGGWAGLSSRPGFFTHAYQEWVTRCLGQNQVLQYGDSMYVIYPRGIVHPDGTLNPEQFSYGAFWLGVGRGLLQVLLTLVPPWAIQKASQLAIVPQVWLGYVLWPWAAVGMAAALWRRGFPAAFGVVVVTLLTLSFAATEANVGTALRHRDILMPFYLMYSAGGLLAALAALTPRQELAGQAEATT